MKKLILTAVFTAICFMTSAQVGIGTTNPETTLHVVGANATGLTNTPGALNAVDGIVVPVVTDDMTTTTTNGTKVSQLVYSNNAASTGFYFWSGTAWISLSTDPLAVGSVTSALSITTVSTAEPYTVLDTDRVIFITNETSGANYDLVLPDPASHTGRLICLISGDTQFSFNPPHQPTGGTQNVPANGASFMISTGTEWKLLRAAF